MRKKEYHFRNPETGDVDYIETEISSSHQFGLPDGRKEKKKSTPESMHNANVRERQKKIRHTLLANFKEGDYFLTLTWFREKRPGTLDDGKKVVQCFLRKLRKEYQKLGAELKYIGTLERGERGGLHFHVVINRIQGSDALIDLLWSKNGRPNVRFLYRDGRFDQLADYLGKDQEERWHTRSRNMVQPSVKTRNIKEPKDLLTEVPEVKKGFQIVSDSVYSGINPYTGRAYLKYAQEKVGKIRKADIFIVASDTCRKGRIAWALVLEYKGRIRKKRGSCHGSIDAAYLEAAIKALSMITDKRTDIRIHADGKRMASRMKELPALAERGFADTDGNPIEFRDEWIRIWTVMARNKISVITGEHHYTAILRRKIGDTGVE